MTATVMRTTHVPVSRHDQYNKAWPILEGLVPVSDQVLGRRWPSNHLAFAYGNHLPTLAEVAERMDLGYTIWTRDGAEYSRPS
jgi:L-fucose isomerase-like protein